MTWAIAVTAASAAIGTTAAVMQGQAQARAFEAESRAAEYRAEQDRIDAEWAQMQAETEMVQRDEELQETLAYNLAGAGYDPYSSMSFLAIEGQNQRVAERDKRQIQLEGQSRAAASLSNRLQNLNAAGWKLESASLARRGGWVRGLERLTTGGAQVAQIS